MFTQTINAKSSQASYLIVGAGLAGCLLAWRLRSLGQCVQLLGSRTLPSAYRVAAGVINPVTGRWITKTWNADELLPVAADTYRALERALRINVYQPIPEIRFCQNADDVKRVGRRMRNPRYADVLGDFYQPDSIAPQFNDPMGAFEIKQAAYVDLPQVVEAIRADFAKYHAFTDATFDAQFLRPASGGWAYQGLSSSRVIFCQGSATTDNPWFNDLALKPVKGETLLCRSSTLDLPQKLYHHTKWFLPYTDGRFRIGATYDEQDPDPNPTEVKAQLLLKAAHTALRRPHDIEVIAHLAGIRPSTVDSRPIVGAHPREPGLFVLNGLGSKGASTGPAMVDALAEHLVHSSPIPTEVALERFNATR